MIGGLIKQIAPALAQFARYHVGRIFQRTETPPKPREQDLTPEPHEASDMIVVVPDPMSIATEASIAELSDQLGLHPRYTELVSWACHRTDSPPQEILDEPLYKLWTTIPQGLKWTHYFEVYQSVFGPLRSRPLRILEIGIWQGASLRLWREYFEHPATVIVGIDVLPECKRFDAPGTGVHVRIGSQADPAFLQKVVTEFGPFDLIIDDGSHFSSHIISSFNLLYADGLKDAGIYFVEDLHANYWHPWRDSRKSFLDVCKELLEHLHAHYRGAPPADLLNDTPSTRESLAIDVPRVTTMIREIRFFDSMVAIYKARLAHVPYFLRSDLEHTDE